MKNLKIYKTFAALCVASTLTGCGNKDMFDTEKGFNFAVESNNGVVSVTGVEKYYDYSGEQIQILTKDGLFILTSVKNTELVKSSDKEDLEDYITLKAGTGDINYVDVMNGRELDFDTSYRKGWVDTTYTFDKFIMQEDDHILVGNVKQWDDYEDDKMQITLNNNIAVLLYATDVKLVATNGNDEAFYNYCLSLVGDEEKIFYSDVPSKGYSK